MSYNSKYAIILANRRSPHLEAWLSLWRSADRKFRLIDTHAGTGSVVGRFARVVVCVAMAAVLALRTRDRSVIEAHGAGFPGLLASVVPGVRVVVVHGSEVLRPGLTRKWLFWWISRRAHAVVVTAESTRDAIATAWPAVCHKIHVIHPGIEWDVFRGGCGRNVGGLDEDIRMVSIRRLQPLYNIDAMLEGVARYADTIVSGSVSVTLLRGDVPHGEPYEARIRDRIGLEEARIDVQFIGRFLGRWELADVFNDSDIAISLAGSDQLSATILEALASGCVLIVSDLAAYRAVTQLPHVFPVTFPISAENVAAACAHAVAYLQRKEGLGSSRVNRSLAAQEALRASGLIADRESLAVIMCPKGF